MRAGLSLAFALTLTLSARAAEPRVIKLWPGPAPGETKEIGPELLVEPRPGQAGVKRLTNVSEPTITIYTPPKEKANGTAVIVAPGGGYSILAIEHEGTQTCEWLNSLGVTAVLLKYRVPRRAMQLPDNLAMIQDAQRALTLVRSLQNELRIDPTRIGMLGFSAGGHLAACAALTQKRLYDGVDKADEAYPHGVNFALLIYPGGLVDKAGHLKPEFAVRPGSPPMFFEQSTDDPVNSENCVALYRELLKNRVPAEMHLYAAGGHGYGMRKSDHPCATWPDRAADWLRSNGWLEAKRPPAVGSKR